jgi:hypothetical protein
MPNEKRVLDYFVPQTATERHLLRIIGSRISERERTNALIAFATLDFGGNAGAVADVVPICALPAARLSEFDSVRAALLRGNLPTGVMEPFAPDSDNWMLYSARMRHPGDQRSTWCAVEMIDPYELWDGVYLSAVYETPELPGITEQRRSSSGFTVSAPDIVA